MSLIHCIYASTAAAGCDVDELEHLLSTARMNNAQYDITGMLLSVGNNFLQIIEGEADAVDELFLHIAGDPRHTAVTEIIRETIVSRRFGDWAMAYAAADRSAIDAHEHLHRCWQAFTEGQPLEAGCAYAMLLTFLDR